MQYSSHGKRIKTTPLGQGRAQTRVRRNAGSSYENTSRKRPLDCTWHTHLPRAAGAVRACAPSRSRANDRGVGKDDWLRCRGRAVRMTPDAFLAELYPKIRMSLPENTYGVRRPARTRDGSHRVTRRRLFGRWACTHRSPKDFVLKACGLAEYLVGNHSFIDFRYVRNCIRRGVPVEVTLVPMSSVIRAAADYPINQHSEEVRALTPPPTHRAFQTGRLPRHIVGMGVGRVHGPRILLQCTRTLCARGTPSWR